MNAYIRPLSVHPRHQRDTPGEERWYPELVRGLLLIILALDLGAFRQPSPSVEGAGEAVVAVGEAASVAAVEAAASVAAAVAGCRVVEAVVSVAAVEEGLLS